MSWLSFRTRVCHRCNLATPSLRYCHEMYGGKFMQAYGWYVNQTFFRIGLRAGSLTYLEDTCPEDLRTAILRWREVSQKYQAEAQRLMALAYGPYRPDIARDEVTYWHNVKKGEETLYEALRRKTGQLRQVVLNRVESITRQEFGLRGVGDGWVSETIVFGIVSRLSPGRELLRHYRPEWLQGLELDIFIPSLNTGIEYQGQQHFHAVTAWGGVAGLRSLQRRDARKAELCRRKGVRLLTVDYTEPLTPDHIEQRLSDG